MTCYSGGESSRRSCELLITAQRWKGSLHYSIGRRAWTRPLCGFAVAPVEPGRQLSQEGSGFTVPESSVIFPAPQMPVPLLCGSLVFCSPCINVDCMNMEVLAWWPWSGVRLADWVCEGCLFMKDIHIFFLLLEVVSKAVFFFFPSLNMYFHSTSAEVRWKHLLVLSFHCGLLGSNS